MPRFALGIEYDGTDFFGWQLQKTGEPSIQQFVERAISKVANHPVEIICAGRTDRGVHATGQVVHFDTFAVRTPHQWQRGINTYLPRTIRIQWAQQVPEDFHARYSAVSRRYCYILDTRPVESAMAYRCMTWHRFPLCVDAMHTAAQILLGEHDFSAFRAADCQSHSPMRCLTRLSVTPHRHGVLVDITGNAFLHHMVRNIVGVLCAIGRGLRPIEDMPKILASRDRTQAGVMAPAAGLYLVQVHYPAQCEVPVASVPFFF